MFKLGRTLDSQTQDQIAKVISRHLDAFAWAASDMPGIDLDFLCHRLAMDPQIRPIRQRRRKFNEEKMQAIKEETQNGSLMLSWSRRAAENGGCALTLRT